eukprot:413742_1
MSDEDCKEISSSIPSSILKNENENEKAREIRALKRQIRELEGQIRELKLGQVSQLKSTDNANHSTYCEDDVPFHFEQSMDILQIESLKKERRNDLFFRGYIRRDIHLKYADCDIAVIDMCKVYYDDSDHTEFEEHIQQTSIDAMDDIDALCNSPQFDLANPVHVERLRAKTEGHFHMEKDVYAWDQRDLKWSFLSYEINSDEMTNLRYVGYKHQVERFTRFLFQQIRRKGVLNVRQFLFLIQCDDLQKYKSFGARMMISVCHGGKTRLQLAQFVEGNHVTKLCTGWCNMLHAELDGITDKELKGNVSEFKGFERIDIASRRIFNNNGTKIAYMSRSFIENAIMWVQMDHLFYYSRWTLKFAQIDGRYIAFERKETILVIFNLGITTKRTHKIVYAVIRSANAKHTKIESFECIALMTAKQIQNALNITISELPSKPQERYHRYLRSHNLYPGDIYIYDEALKCSNFKALKIIKPRTEQTQDKRLPRLIITPRWILRRICAEFEKDGYNKELSGNRFVVHVKHPIFIISWCGKQGRESYFIDVLLPIEIKRGRYIGISFRQGKPKEILFDWFDIQNKAMLFDPTLKSFNRNQCIQHTYRAVYRDIVIDLQSDWR